MIEWWHAILFGIVEGVTEFLPISSTGHLTLVEGILGFDVADPSVTAFTAIIQVGAMVAAIIYFWSDIVRFATAWFRGLRIAEHRQDPDYRMGWAIIVGFAITAVIALVFKDLVEGPLRSLWAVVAGLLGWSVVMLAADRLAKVVRDEHSITWRDGAVLGLVQAISLVPGVSRSGATIAGGLFRGLDRVSATRMSFFLGVPTLIASGAFQAVTEARNIGAPGGVGWAATALGTVVSGVVAYASIAWLLKFVTSHDFTAFIIYRVLLAGVIITLLLTGVIPAV
jgi:undecaprenyl-diphosphatase